MTWHSTASSAAIVGILAFIAAIEWNKEAVTGLD